MTFPYPLKLSIRTTLTLWYCVVFCLVVCLLEGAVYVGLKAAMTATIDNELDARLHGLEEFLQEHLARLPLPRVLTDLQVHFALQPELSMLQDEHGHTLYCGALVQPLCNRPATRLPIASGGGHAFRLHAADSTVRGTHYTLVVASDLQSQRDLLTRFRALVLLIIPLALLCAALGGYWLAGRAFAPVREIIASLRAIDERSLSLRLRVPSTGDEIQVLSETLNRMLGRVETSFLQVTELTANASHELRTPIAIIRTTAEVALLHCRPTLSSYRKALLQIGGETEKTTRLLDGLLLLARSDAGLDALHLTELRLADSVRKALDACAALAEARHLRLTLHSPSPDPAVLGDALQLHRLWLLLLDNAIKYTAPGGAVTVTVEESASGEATCQIRDTGIGIEPADLPNLFQRFFRASNARAHAETGFGLGLPMAQWIANAHRAHIQVSSQPLQGTSFWVRFPVEGSLRANVVQQAPGNWGRAAPISAASSGGPA